MKWFKEVFLPSFGLCKDKRITEKQACIFMKYLKSVTEYECCTNYKGILYDKNIFLQDSIQWAGWKNGKPQKRHVYYLTIGLNKIKAV